jgi:hypothetical protein
LGYKCEDAAGKSTVSPLMILEFIGRIVVILNWRIP